MNFLTTFGHDAAAISYHGIVDSDDSDDFYAKLCSLEDVWNAREWETPHSATGLSKMLLTQSTHGC